MYYVHCLDVEEEEEGNDWLYTVIADIITAHNDMVELPKQVASQPFRRLLPNQQATAYPREITNASCIIPQFKKYVGTCTHTDPSSLQIYKGLVTCIYIRDKEYELSMGVSPTTVLVYTHCSSYYHPLFLQTTWSK